MTTKLGGGIEVTITAAADLSANQYGGVTIAGGIPGAGALIAGVQQDGGVTGEGPLSGQPVRVVALGFSKVLTNNSNIAVGSTITPAGTTGKFKLSAADTDYLAGIAFEANGSTDGRIITALICPMGRVASA